MRKDAPDQANTVDPDKLSTEVEKLRSIQNEILSYEGPFGVGYLVVNFKLLNL